MQPLLALLIADHDEWSPGVGECTTLARWQRVYGGVAVMAVRVMHSSREVGLVEWHAHEVLPQPTHTRRR
jgi:hypothetical protein